MTNTTHDRKTKLNERVKKVHCVCKTPVKSFD